MGQRLTEGELKTIRCALASYRDIKKKESGLKKNEAKSDNYERLLVKIDDTIELFDGDVKSVYVNK